MSGMDAGAYHAEQLALQKDVEATLLRAEKLGLTKDELKLLYWATGIQNKLNQGESNEMGR
jgi:hypothetical protein